MLKKILLSHDIEEHQQNVHFSRAFSKFLDGESIEGDKIVLATFPRTGNTFLRKFLEDITLCATGSDMDSLALQMSNLMGEKIVDDTVWFRKSHLYYPLNKVPPFKVNKLITCVRNPLDTVCSLLQLTNTLTQNKEIQQDYHVEFKDYFEKYALSVAQSYCDYYY